MNTQRWRLTLDRELNNEIVHIEKQFQQVFGSKPSKTEIVKLLMENVKNKRLKKKGRTRICFM